jgi:hypothetical protein
MAANLTPRAWMDANGRLISPESRDGCRRSSIANRFHTPLCALAEAQKLQNALADAVRWIEEMRCDDLTTHPRLRVLRAALGKPS